mgnify:CR=1 FL=1
MKRKNSILAAAITLVMLFSMSACGGAGESPASPDVTATVGSAAPGTEGQAAEPAEPVVIDLVSTFPAGNVNYEAGKLIADKVEELTNGQVKFNFLGGSEIFSGGAGAEAVMSGALDAVFTAADYFTGFVPEAAAICASDMTYAEMLASGGIDYINGIFTKHGVRLLYVVDEVGISGTQLFTNSIVSSLDDLKGMSIRTTGTVQGNILTALGCTPTPLGLGEIFTGLEQGLIQGYCGPAYLGGAMGFFEYSKCVISTEIARGGSSLLINEDVWASIPADLQMLLTDSLSEVNEAEVALYSEYVANNQKALTDAGGQIVELSEEDSDELSALCMSYAWDGIESSVDADTYEALKKVFLK